MVNQKKRKKHMESQNCITWSGGGECGRAGERRRKKILVILSSSTRGKMRDSVANIMGVAMFTASKLSKVCQVWPKKFW